MTGDAPATAPAAPAPFTVRDAAPADAPAIAAFNVALAQETEGKRLDRETLAAGVAAVLADPAKGRYWVAVDSAGDVVGQVMVTWEWSDWRNGPFWWVQSVYVAPAARGRGVFRALLARVRECADAAGAVGIRLYVEADNAPARATYARCGFTPAGYDVLERPAGGPGA